LNQLCHLKLTFPRLPFMTYDPKGKMEPMIAIEPDLVPEKSFSLLPAPPLNRNTEAPEGLKLLPPKELYLAAANWVKG
jgi:hypothetical protein